MCETIDSGSLPVRVKEFYVFGSYARGALEPHDLDVIVIYENPGREFWDALDRLWEIKRCPVTTLLRKGLCKPGECIDLGVFPTLDYIVGKGSTIKKKDVTLLWSDSSRDWRPKLDAIRPNPLAGSKPRNHLFPIKRLACDLTVMKEVTAMVENGVLKLIRLDPETVERELTPYHLGRLDRCGDGRIGKKSLSVLPCALQWLETHRQQVRGIDTSSLWTDSDTHRVSMGHPALWSVIWYFKRCPKLKRHCLIPHFKRGGPNELLVFERGPKWREWLNADGRTA